MRKGIVVCTFVLAFCAAYASAQSYPDTLKVDYFANAGSTPDETVRMTNPGTSGTGLCAAVFVFDASEEMNECCSCYLSPDGLRTLSVNTDLLSNPFTGTSPTTGPIKIVSIPSSGRTCPTYPTKLSPTAGIRAWATHLQNSGALTETSSQDATLSSTEITNLQNECKAIHLDGSGHGLCTCGSGD